MPWQKRLVTARQKRLLMAFLKVANRPARSLNLTSEQVSIVAEAFKWTPWKVRQMDLFK